MSARIDSLQHSVAVLAAVLLTVAFVVFSTPVVPIA